MAALQAPNSTQQRIRGKIGFLCQARWPKSVARKVLLAGSSQHKQRGGKKEELTLHTLNTLDSKSDVRDQQPLQKHSDDIVTKTKLKG